MIVRTAPEHGYRPWGRKRWTVCGGVWCGRRPTVLGVALVFAGPARSLLLSLVIGVGATALTAVMLFSYDVDVLTVWLMPAVNLRNAALAVARVSEQHPDMRLRENLGTIFDGDREAVRQAEQSLYANRYVYRPVPAWLMLTLNLILTITGAVIGGRAQQVLVPPQERRVCRRSRNYVSADSAWRLTGPAWLCAAVTAIVCVVVAVVAVNAVRTARDRRLADEAAAGGQWPRILEARSTASCSMR